MPNVFTIHVLAPICFQVSSSAAHRARGHVLVLHDVVEELPARRELQDQVELPRRLNDLVELDDLEPGLW